MTSSLKNSNNQASDVSSRHHLRRGSISTSVVCRSPSPVKGDLTLQTPVVRDFTFLRPASFADGVHLPSSMAVCCQLVHKALNPLSLLRPWVGEFSPAVQISPTIPFFFFPPLTSPPRFINPSLSRNLLSYFDLEFLSFALKAYPVQSPVTGTYFALIDT